MSDLFELSLTAQRFMPCAFSTIEGSLDAASFCLECISLGFGLCKVLLSQLIQFNDVSLLCFSLIVLCNTDENRTQDTQKCHLVF